MTGEPIRAALQQIFRQVFKDPALTVRDDMTAADVPSWDSLSHIAMIVAVEKHFKVKFRNLEIARLKKVGDLVNLIAAHRPDQKQAA